MRVALVAMETARHRETAGGRRFERIARGLADAGHDVTVFCTRWWGAGRDAGDGTGDSGGGDAGAPPPETTAEGVRYRAVTADRSIAAFCLRLPVLLWRYGPDVIHVRPTPPAQVIAASVGVVPARAPLILEWFGDESLDPRARSTRWVVEEPHLLVSPSELVRTSVRELGAPDDRVRVLPESIDFSAIEAADPATGVDVAYAHRLDASANVESLLLGLAELRDRDWTATVIGDGPMRSDYERQAADLRIDDRVSFVGACDRERRLSIYRGAHAFVQTASREYFATELLWALSCGCVGIVEYQAESSAHELIENYDRSFRVTSPGQIADAIVDAGGFDHQTVDDRWERYDHDAVIGDYVDTYERLIDDWGWGRF